MTERLPLGTLVEYTGSHRNGRYVIRAYSDLSERKDLPPEAVAEGYPDGIAYDLWPPGVPVKFGNRDQAVYFVRPANVTAVTGGEAP
jgi:hypothetical protein